MKVRLGHKASMRGMQPQVALAIHLVSEALQDSAIRTLWVSSIADREHSPGSLHYLGCAFDLVPAPWPARPQQIADHLHEALGPEWDVVLEPSHIHAEWQPKAPQPR